MGGLQEEIAEKNRPKHALQLTKGVSTGELLVPHPERPRLASESGRNREPALIMKGCMSSRGEKIREKHTFCI